MNIKDLVKNVMSGRPIPTYFSGFKKAIITMLISLGTLGLFLPFFPGVLFYAAAGWLIIRWKKV